MGIISFLVPGRVDFCDRRSGGGEEPSGESPPSDSDPFDDGEFQENLRCLSTLFAAGTNRGFKFEKSGQLLIRTRWQARSFAPQNQRLRPQPKSQRRLLKLQTITVTRSISRNSPTVVFQNSNKYLRRESVPVSLASASVPEPSLCLRQERYCLSHQRIAHHRLQ
jgi:hypothetical protein